MKLNRPFLALAVLTAFAVSAASALAGSGCPDDPERCIERGATVSHRTVAAPPTTSVTTTATAHASQVTVATHKAPVAAPAHKSATKPARTVSPATPAPATPGMGMLLKLSNGSGGEVSLFPSSKPNDTTQGASWVL